MDVDYVDDGTLRAVRRAASTFTEIIHTASNDPSVGLVFVHDHVRRSLPAIAERKREIKATGLRVEGMMYDMAYTRQVTEGLRAMKTFDALKRQLIYAARLKNEIDRASQRPSRVEAMSEFSFRGLTELVTPALLGGSAAARANIDPVGVSTADAPSPSYDVLPPRLDSPGMSTAPAVALVDVEDEGAEDGKAAKKKPAKRKPATSARGREGELQFKSFD